MKEPIIFFVQINSSFFGNRIVLFQIEMFRKCCTGAVPVKETAPEEGTIAVEEDADSRNGCCFVNGSALRNTSKKFPSIIRYYKRMPFQNNVPCEERVYGSAENIYIEQNTPVPKPFSNANETKSRSTNSNLTRRVVSEKDLDSNTEKNEENLTPEITINENTKKNCKLSWISQTSLVSCQPTGTDKLGPLHFLRCGRSRSLHISTDTLKMLAKKTISHPSSPVLKSNINSPSKTTSDLTKYNKSSVSNQNGSKNLTKSHSKLKRSSCVSIFSSASHTSLSATRLFPMTDLPPPGRMRRVFTTHVRRRRTKKPPSICVHLTDLLKEPIRIVHSMPLDPDG